MGSIGGGFGSDEDRSYLHADAYRRVRELEDVLRRVRKFLPDGLTPDALVSEIDELLKPRS